MIAAEPKNVRIVCTPSNLEIPLKLIYTGTRTVDGKRLDVWRNTFDVILPQGTTEFHLAADNSLTTMIIDVEIGQ